MNIKLDKNLDLCLLLESKISYGLPDVYLLEDIEETASCRTEVFSLYNIKADESRELLATADVTSLWTSSKYFKDTMDELNYDAILDSCVEGSSKFQEFFDVDDYTELLFLDKLWVDPNYRGKGIGSAFLSLIKEALVPHINGIGFLVANDIESEREKRPDVAERIATFYKKNHFIPLCKEETATFFCFFTDLTAEGHDMHELVTGEEKEVPPVFIPQREPSILDAFRHLE